MAWLLGKSTLEISWLNKIPKISDKGIYVQESAACADSFFLPNLAVLFLSIGFSTPVKEFP